MTLDFVQEKGLDFIEAPDIGDFWGGVDACGEHSYELFFTAGPEGPTLAQVEHYRLLCESFESVYTSIIERYHTHLTGMDAGRRNKWLKVPMEVLLVSVNDEGKDCQIELTCTGTRGFLVFKRSLSFLAKVSDNRLVAFEVS